MAAVDKAEVVREEEIARVVDVPAVVEIDPAVWGLEVLEVLEVLAAAPAVVIKAEVAQEEACPEVGKALVATVPVKVVVVGDTLLLIS